MTLNIVARKYYADGKGKETETPLKSGTQVLHLVTSRVPAFAGIDPYNKWIDRNSDDNVTSVSAFGG